MRIGETQSTRGERVDVRRVNQAAVTAVALRVTDAEIVGWVQPGEIVPVEEVSADGLWVKVGGVADTAAELGVEVLVVAGQVFDGVDARVPTVSLAQRFGLDEAMADPLGCVERAVADALAGRAG